MTPMCPHCLKPMVVDVVGHPVTVSMDNGTKWKAIAYCCGLCNKTLSVQIDPTTIRTDVSVKG